MELKVILNKPCSEKEKTDFIVAQNHINGYEIREFENVIEAWGYTDKESEEIKREKIKNLSLTKREVFLAIYQDKQITPNDIRSKITNTEGLIEFDYAQSFYRGNPLIDTIGIALGYTEEQLDNLFQYKKFNKD